MDYHKHTTPVRLGNVYVALLQYICLVMLIPRTTCASTIKNNKNLKAGGISDFLRGDGDSNFGGTSTLPLDIEPWISVLKSGDFGHGAIGGTVDDKNLTPESLWQIWNSLTPGARDMWIRKFYPLLIPNSSGSEGQKWRLHCADAYKLCMADSNCYWKYKNFLDSCTMEDSVPQRASRKRRRHIEFTSDRTGWSEVYKVDSMMKKKVRPVKHRRRAQRRRRAYWMGELLEEPGKANRYTDMLYFSLKSRSNKCSFKCVNALIMLNDTVYGGLLAHCDCRAKTLEQAYFSGSVDLGDSSKRGDKDRVMSDWEDTCKLHQRTAHSCRPRAFHGSESVMGCTEARKRCQKDPTCLEAQKSFLASCSQVINGVRCTKACDESVRKLRKATKHYDTCVCDTVEGPTCHQIRSNVVRLCNITDVVFEDTGETQRHPPEKGNWTPSTKGSPLQTAEPTNPDVGSSSSLQRTRAFDENARGGAPNLRPLGSAALVLLYTAQLCFARWLIVGK